MPACAVWVKDALSTVFWADANTQTKFSRADGYWSKEGLVDPKSQREDWYKVRPYISEFWCTVSNVGFLVVGARHRSWELVFAGCASIASHSIPKQWLLTLDKVGVAIVLTKFIAAYPLIRQHPWLIAPAVVTGLVSAIDVYLARKYGTTWSHVVWHLTSAACADIFLSHMKG